MNINESLGVPDGLTKEAKRIKTEFLEKISNLNIDTSSGWPNFIIVGIWDIKFSDFEIIGLPIILRIEKYDNLDYPVLLGATYGNKSEWMQKSGKLYLSSNIPTSFISIDIACEKIDQDKIKDLLKKEVAAPLFAHEMHHLYEASKSGKRSIKKLSNYKSYQISNLPKIISDFLHILYYVTTIENFVRPSEMLSIMEEEGIKKSDFRNWIMETDMMKIIEEARNFSIQEFLEKASKDTSVKLMLLDARRNDFKSSGDDKKDIMRIVLINISNEGSELSKKILDTYFAHVSGNHSSVILGFLGIESPEIKKARDICNKEFNDIVKFYNKWDGKEEKYFDFLQKRINFAGEKMKKKLSKLWTHLNESNSGSILNWDLWTKVYNDKPISTKLNINQIQGSFNAKSSDLFQNNG